MPLPSAGAYFGFYFPDATSAPGVAFEPSIGPQIGTVIHENDGAITDLAADNATLYVYQIADPKDIYELHFAFWTESDRAAWKTFRNAAGTSLFTMLDSISGSSFVVGLWAFERDFTYDYETGQRTSVVMNVYRPGV